jgi:peptidoglycan hydrolase-like protein with peptidoglycan-binding domain
MTYTLGVGAFGNDVRRLQEYLNVELTASLVPDGSFGGATKAEVLRFRTRFGLPASPTFDEQCFAVSGTRGFSKPAFDSAPAKGGTTWPKKPSGLSSPSGALMQQKCGTIDFVWTPAPGNPEHITVTNSFAANHIETVDIPQLRNCVVPLGSGVTKTDGRIRFHKNHVGRLRDLFAAWEDAKLIDHILTFDGSFVQRLKRGSKSGTVANLSNHSWGTAFDINAAWNPRGHHAALMGDRGCVRDMVAIAHAHGFFWGGHFGTIDGMHFEVAAESL